MKPRSFTLRSDVDHDAIEAGWNRVRARREARAGSRARARAALFVAPVVALAAILFFMFGRGTLPVASSPLARPLLSLQDGTALPAEISAPVARVVALDDGSRLELHPGSKLRTAKVEPARVELALDTGRTTFDVKPGGPRAWVIDAGEVTVKVLGTRFSVGRDASSVEVSVERGKVLVEGAGVAGGSRILTAGESVVVRHVPTQAPPVPVAALRDADDRAPPALLAAPPAEVAAPSKRSPASPASPATPATPATPAAATGSPAQPTGDAMARADAARREARPREAASILSAMVEAHDARASLAAFTLGKLHAEDLGDARNAAAWFERAFALGLPAGLDEQALARAVESHARAGSKSQAARVATQYEARFPRGRHLENVRGWARD